MERKGTYIAYDASGISDSVNSNQHTFRQLSEWQRSQPDGFCFVNMQGIQFSTEHKDFLDSTMKSYMLKEMASADNMLVVASPVVNTESPILNWQISRGVNRFHLPVVIAYYGQEAVSEESVRKYWVWLPEKLRKYISRQSWCRMAHIPLTKDKLRRAINFYSASQQRYPWDTMTIF
ncbi:MAG: hypothetical protein LUC33_00015 [Prevotellaceae bacterium]|nr:hypothetical protein [Prevotellaceae bacterium]